MINLHDIVGVAATPEERLALDAILKRISSTTTANTPAVAAAAQPR